MTVTSDKSVLSLAVLTKHAAKTKNIRHIPNENICFPIGTILAVNKLYDVLDFSTVFGKHKKNGIDINKLLKALVSYKLTDNFSISKAHEWINRDEVLEIFDLEEFSERTLYRVVNGGLVFPNFGGIKFPTF